MTAHLLAAVAALTALVLALRRGWLTGRATAAAAVVGAAVWAGVGPPGVALLVIFFVSASALSRLPGAGGRRSASRGSAPAAAGPGREGGEEGRPRGARQVLANGGVAAAAALALPSGAASSAVLGALAAATADTWSSEVGRALGGATRRVTDGRPVPPGTPGGISPAGSAAGLAGAALLGVAAAALGLSPEGESWARPVAVALVAGAGGALLDSVLGARRHGSGGEADSDLVNLLGTAAGAAIAVGASATLA